MTRIALFLIGVAAPIFILAKPLNGTSKCAWKVLKSNFENTWCVLIEGKSIHLLLKWNWTRKKHWKKSNFQTDIEQVHPPKEYRNFKEFLEKCLEKNVLQYTVRPLTKPGDNYNSMLQAIEVKSVRGNDSNDVSSAVNWN